MPEQRYLLLRRRGARRPVTWTPLPISSDFEQAIREFANPETCEVKTVTSDGSRESLAAAFRDNDGWRPAKT